MGLGVKFFIINISVLIMLNTDNIVITQLLRPDKVTVFNISYKLFSIMSSRLFNYWHTLMECYTEAYAKRILMDKNTLKATQKVWVF